MLRKIVVSGCQSAVFGWRCWLLLYAPKLAITYRIIIGAKTLPLN